MPWNSRDFYKTVKTSIFQNTNISRKTYRQKLVQLQKQKRKAVGKLISLLNPEVTTKQFNKRLLSCKQLPTSKGVSRINRCGTFICPFCFYRRLYLFFRGPLRQAIEKQKAKYLGITFSETYMLQPPDESGLFGRYLFDPSFIPTIQTRADAEQMAARLFTVADLQRRYEQAWFTNDAVNCQANEPLGGFSSTWFDYNENKNMFLVNRLSLHLTNTNALSFPVNQGLDTRVNFTWHFASDFDPCVLFNSFSFPYGLYSALLKTTRTEYGPANVVAYLFGMRRLLDKKFRLQQTWGCLHAAAS